MEQIPRSKTYINERLVAEGNVRVGQLKYYMRVFECGCAELVRYNTTEKKWVFLCFPAENKTLDTVTA